MRLVQRSGSRGLRERKGKGRLTGGVGNRMGARVTTKATAMRQVGGEMACLGCAQVNSNGVGGGVMRYHPPVISSNRAGTIYVVEKGTWSESVESKAAKKRFKYHKLRAWIHNHATLRQRVL